MEGIEMNTIKKKYIVDENNNPVAVQLDINTFEKIEEVLENFALVQLILENENEELLSKDEALKYYQKLDKAE